MVMRSDASSPTIERSGVSDARSGHVESSTDYRTDYHAVASSVLRAPSHGIAMGMVVGTRLHVARPSVRDPRPRGARAARLV